MPDFEIRLLGGFDARIDGKALPPLRSRREQWLLALLVLRHERETARDWLAATLWPDNDTSQTLFYLRKSLSNLRRALGSESARLLTPTPRSVRLNLTEAFADVVAFDNALKRVPASSDPLPLLQEAVSLYRGPLLSDCPEEWVIGERRQREQAYLAALDNLAAQFHGNGDPAEAARWLRLLTVADPYRESAYGRLMQALAACGDVAAVRAVYRELREKLRHDLNTSPSPDIEAIYQQASEPSTQVPAAPPPPYPARRRRQLPVPLSERIGREGEIAEIREFMKRRRLITLVGTGGIGKTRLSIAVAEAALEDFEDGVWFVDLAALTDSSLVPQATAKVLGIAEERTRSITESLVGTLSEQKLLLIIDNCEQVLEGCASLSERLLSACPQLRIIATSRQSLNIAGEQVYPVPALPVPPLEPLEETDPQKLLDYEAIRLFVDRAICVNRDFRLHRQNASVVARICQQLDGIPLAIEMAAARLRSLSVNEISARLAERFRLLTSGNRGVLPRQQTLRATIAWSYDLLSEAERVLLRRLSVFQGGWTVEAAEAVFGPFFQDDSTVTIEDLLFSLAEKSLLLRWETVEGTTRYGMLETIRYFALELLAVEGDRVELRLRHLDYFLKLAETSRPKLNSPDRVQWLARLDSENDNLRQALVFCQESRELGEKGLRLGAASVGFWIARGHLGEGRMLTAALLAHWDAQKRTKYRADALYGAGLLAYSQNDSAAASALFAEGLEIARELGERKIIADILASLGNMAARQGDFVAGREFHHESLALRRALDDPQGIGSNLNSLGIMAQEQGDYTTAQALHEESLAIRRDIGDYPGIAGSLNNLGILADVQGDYPAAERLYSESLELHRIIGPRTLEAANLAGLANVAYHRADYPAARRLYEESLSIRRELKDDWGIAICLEGLGATAISVGDPVSALALQQESLALTWKMGNLITVTIQLKEIGSLARQSGDLRCAARLWGAMSALSDRIGTSLSPSDRVAWEEEVSRSRTALGEEKFDATFQTGREMTTDDAVREALAFAFAGNSYAKISLTGE